MTKLRTGVSVIIVGTAGVVGALLSPGLAVAGGPTASPTVPVVTQADATQPPATTTQPPATTPATPTTIPSPVPTTPEPPSTRAQMSTSTSEAVPTAVPAGSGGAGAPTDSSGIKLDAAAGAVGLALVAGGAIGLTRRARRS